MQSGNNFDVAVIGAGIFGVWTAYQLTQTGAKVLLVDSYGPGNSRASSGGESRIIRMGYGPDEIYSNSALRSLALWKEFFARVDTNPPLFRQTGVLWLAKQLDPYCEAIFEILPRLGVSLERLAADELKQRYPQIEFAEETWGLLEPDSGALMARRAVQKLAAETVRQGAALITQAIAPPNGAGKLDSITSESGAKIFAAHFVFACGPWLPKIFPELLKDLIHVTRQEIFFFGTPAGDASFSPPDMPIWVDFNALVYAIPDLDHRGFKVAIDAHGPEFDPDNGQRMVTNEGLEAARAYLKRRVPALANAPVTESRVCQYENTANGDFLIDRHPDFSNVWLAGGGSGHGFKHGPAVGEYVSALISGTAAVEPRFGLKAKGSAPQREVY